MSKKKYKQKHKNNKLSKPKSSFLKDNSKNKIHSVTSYQVHNIAYEVFGSLFYTSCDLEPY